MPRKKAVKLSWRDGLAREVVKLRAMLEGAMMLTLQGDGEALACLDIGELDACCEDVCSLVRRYQDRLRAGQNPDGDEEPKAKAPAKARESKAAAEKADPRQTTMPNKIIPPTKSEANGQAADPFDQ